MAKTKQRRIENRKERRQGKEITQRWIIAAQSQRGVEDEEEWWLKNMNRVQHSQAKRARRGNYTLLPDEGAVTYPPEDEKALETKKGTPPTDGRMMTNLPIEGEWFESIKNVQPRRCWLLAILILPIITVITLLIGFLAAYKRISSTHP